MIDLLQATKNQTKAAQLIRMSFDQINRILHRATERGMKRRQGIDNIIHISIDEKSFKRGHEYVTVLSSPQTGSILDVSHGRKKESVEKVIDSTFNKGQQAKIQSVTTDMWEAYINTVKEKLSKADLCHDKFHLVKYLNEAVDQVRRKEVKTQEALKKTKYIWLKDKINLTENQRIVFEAINATNYQTAQAWRIKENFRDITFNQPMMAGYYIYNRWSDNAKKSKIAPIVKVAEMFDRHKAGIVNAMTLGKNNSMAERLNGKIQEIKISGKGYRRFENFRSAILFFHGKLNLYPQETQ